MELKYGFVCDAANVSSDGKLNVLGVFDVINAASVPAVQPTFYLVLQFEAEAPEKGLTKEIQITLIDDDGNTLFAIKKEEKVPDVPGIRVPFPPDVIRMDNLKFEGYGRYEFRVLISGEPKGAVPLDVCERRVEPVD